MRQHDAAAAHANARRGGRHRANHHFRAVASEARRAVMFGEPVTVVAQAVGQRARSSELRSASPAVEPAGIGD